MDEDISQDKFSLMPSHSHHKMLLCYFNIKNLVLKQKICIPMDLEPAPYRANILHYFFESKYVQQLISEGSPHAHKFHGTLWFTDYLCN